MVIPVVRLRVWVGSKGRIVILEVLGEVYGIVEGGMVFIE